jgi:hypothetical protein
MKILSTVAATLAIVPLIALLTAATFHTRASPIVWIDMPEQCSFTWTSDRAIPNGPDWPTAFEDTFWWKHRGDGTCHVDDDPRVMNALRWFYVRWGMA